jgi:hypothetical protein
MPEDYWSGLTDEELEAVHKWNKRRLRCIDKRERAIAHSNIEAILAEKAKRHERRYGL